MKVAFRSVVFLGIIAGSALGEPPQGFDTTGHPLKAKVPRAMIKRAKSAMLASATRSRMFARAYNLPEDDAAREQRREFFEQRHRVCGAVKQYCIKYTPDTLTDSTPVTAFVDWRDSSYQVHLCVEDSVVWRVNVVSYFGKAYCPTAGGANTPRVMRRVLATWPPVEGYNPVFIKFPGISRDWYFHVPEVDAYNLTPLSRTLDYSVDYSQLQYSRSLFNRPQTRGYLKRCADRRKLIMEKLRKEYENENQ